MEVYKSKFLILNYFEIEQYIEMQWLPETKIMGSEEYKQEFMNYKKVIDEYRPKGVLTDTLGAKYTIEPELQEWTNENVFVFSLSIGLDKVAFVINQRSLVERLSIEQTMEEQEGEKFRTRYFADKIEAKKWLVEEIKNSHFTS